MFGILLKWHLEILVNLELLLANCLHIYTYWAQILSNFLYLFFNFMLFLWVLLCDLWSVCRNSTLIETQTYAYFNMHTCIFFSYICFSHRNMNLFRINPDHLSKPFHSIYWNYFSYRLSGKNNYKLTRISFIKRIIQHLKPIFKKLILLFAETLKLLRLKRVYATDKFHFYSSYCAIHA